ncbi:MAG: anthranilate phosphoribosyltransferase, partial [Sinobacterium sp.]|nr:anthranilate phosphoribosyltransferase [Sinobacterium sp.]
MIQAIINQLINLQDLTAEQMTECMQLIMTGGATDAQIAGFLVALRMKGETVDEITAAASVMRKLSAKVDVQGGLLDTCG